MGKVCMTFKLWKIFTYASAQHADGCGVVGGIPVELSVYQYGTWKRCKKLYFSIDDNLSRHAVLSWASTYVSFLIFQIHIVCPE